MRQLKALLLAISLLVGFAAEASADQLFVRNKPFRGAVVGSGDQMYVALEGLARALDMQVTSVNGASVIGPPPERVAPGTVVVNQQVVASTAGPQGELLVCLKDFARASGCKLTVNPSLKSVDLYLPAAAGGSSAPGNWGGKTVFNEPPPPPAAATPGEVIGLFFQAGHKLPPLPLGEGIDVREGEMRRQLNEFFRSVRPYLTREFYEEWNQSRKDKKNSSAIQRALDEDPSLVDDPEFQALIATIILYYEAIRTGTPQILREDIRGKEAVVSFNVQFTNPINQERLETTMRGYLKKEGGAWKLADHLRF